MIENKMHITVRNKQTKQNLVATTKQPLADEMGVHVNTVDNYFKSAVENAGLFENDTYIMIVSWEYVKANRGRFKKG